MFNIVHLEHVCTLCIQCTCPHMDNRQLYRSWVQQAHTHVLWECVHILHIWWPVLSLPRILHVRGKRAVGTRTSQPDNSAPPSNSIMSIVFITPHDEHNTSHAGAYNKPFAVVVIIICQCASCALMWRDGFATAAACNIRRLLPIIDTIHEMRHHDTCTFTVPKRCPSVLPLIYNYPALKRCTIAKGVFESMSIIRLVCVCVAVCVCVRAPITTIRKCVSNCRNMNAVSDCSSSHQQSIDQFGN